ncbi:MAG: transposase [Bacteroidales bacterium]|nr:transposase [Bacteroidales bacterium]MDP1963397.1 transposase [Reyranella sp.]
MFKKSNKEPQLDAFASVPMMLESSAFKQYSDQGHWHNQFHDQVVMRIDETIFSILFNNTTGAPNSSIRTLVGMMVLKESFVWSDSQLFEQCRFNLLVRSALGLFNVNDPLPVESTYYLLRKRMYDHQKQNGEDLMGKAFVQITSEQIKEFDVNGRNIRMDSKLIGSNIALFSRYEIIHQTLCMFFKTLDNTAKSTLSLADLEQLEKLFIEEPLKTVYRSTREELKGRLQPIGIISYKLLTLFGNLQTESFLLLRRVFNEQYKVSADQQIELRPKEEISSSSVQSPHDPDSAYRNKGDQKVKGYSVNITETCSDEGLNLITNVLVEKANIPDTAFVEPAIRATIEVTGQMIEKAYTDGAYQSPANDECCENIDMVFTGIQGAESRYDLEMTSNGLLVTDTKTGELIQAVLVKKRKNSTEDKWSIKTSTGYYYFGQQAIRASNMRREMKGRPLEELHKRNNVEATIFQLSFPLRNNKSKYRGLIKQKIWASCRCLWINLVRILNFTKQICQRTFKTMEIPALEPFSSGYLTLQRRVQRIWSSNFSIALFLLISINFFDLL